MRAEITPGEDATTLYLRWEIHAEGTERQRLRRLGGPLALRIEARHVVDRAGTYHEARAVDVPIYPHAGARNFGQARFADFEARRSFWEHLQAGVTQDVPAFLFETDPAAVPAGGHVLLRADAAPFRDA